MNTKKEIIMSFIRAKIAGPWVSDDDLSHLECLIDYLPEFPEKVGAA